jgi:putative oxidoreductase
MESAMGGLLRCTEFVISQLGRLQAILTLGMRLFIADVFFKSGLQKIRNWDGTLALFENEYQVPFLPTEVAALAATAGELVLPILLAFGLAGRFGAAGLFVVNAVAVLSYWEGLGDIGRTHHYYWGVMIMVPLLFGPGRISIDHILWPRLQRRFAVNR